VLIVGAGLSGIGAAYHLQTQSPRRSYAILEARAALGGTWDLFRYPGIRSDSDMYTLGYAFRPWKHGKAIADGAMILDYIRQTAKDHGIDRKIRFNHRVKRAAWSSEQACWTVEVDRGPGSGPVRLTCNFLFICSGYYSYAQGYKPQFPGQERFAGRIVHPQEWSGDIDHAGKRVVVIGSGATAITLVPALAQSAAHVTMLQRSPSYIVSLPDHDPLSHWLQSHLPERAAYRAVRWRNAVLGMFFYAMARRAPETVKRLLRNGVEAQLGPNYDIDTHFKPRYDPWDQRLCVVPNGDLFQAIRKGRASVVTDQIETFTEHGIALRSGAELEADLIVTATGLNLEFGGGMQLSVDGREVDLSRCLTYKGMMYSDVPNLATALGYTNASWTLKSDLTCEYVCRLLNYMEKHGHRRCTPRNLDPAIQPQPLIGFSSGYVQRSIHKFPKQGQKRPWRVYQNYALDLLSLRLRPLKDSALEFV
jgi:cation diffusion facilitator CzcD-associated flavoprotein CzcO